MAHHTVLLALLLALCATTSALDSEGTAFVFAFVRNANANNITDQVLSASVLNQNAQDCMFTLTYRADYHKATPPQNMTVTAPKNGSIEVIIPNWYGWNYAGESVQDDVFLTLMGYSTCPVTVLANNYDMRTGQGDTFMVLPTTWGSKSFTFSLPPAVISTDQQYEQVFVLPTTEGTTRVNVVEIGNAQSFFSFNATYGNAPAVYIGARTPDKRPRTYHVTSDKDVLIVAGVTCAGADASTCDHTAYMPHPPPASDCYPYDYYDDDHVSYLPTTTQFFTDIPGSCLVGQNITSTLNDGVSRTITIKPQMESPLWTIQTTNAAQLGVAFHNGGSNIHIARYYDGTKFNTRGAFVATSPSITQFHADSTAFYTRNANDSLEIYCTVLGCAAISIDGTKIVIADTKATQWVDGEKYYIFVMTIPNAGFHQISLSSAKGKYSFFVFGKNNQYSYGYEGGVNKPTFVLAPPTTPGPTQFPPTTVTTQTPPSPVTTQTVPTTATPPATLPTSTPTNPGTSKQTTTEPYQTSTTGPLVTISSTLAPQTPASVSAAITTTPSISTQTTNSKTIMTSTQAPFTSPQTPTTQPAVTTTAIQPLVSISSTQPIMTTTATLPVMSSTATKPSMTTTTAIPPVVTTSVTSATPTVGSTAPPPTNPPVTTQTTPAQTPAPTSATTITIPTTVTSAPIPPTVTTNPPVVTTTTNPPVVTTKTTPSLPPRTSSPNPTTVTITTASSGTVGSTVTTPSPAPATGTTPTPAVVNSTVAAPTTTTSTTTTTKPPTTPTTTTPTTPKQTQPVVTTTVIPPVTTATTAGAPTTTTTPKVVPTTPTTVTTQAPTTSTQSSSVVSLALPVVLTILFSLLV